MRLIQIPIIITVLLILFMGCGQGQVSNNLISPAEVKNKIDRNEEMILIDVRTHPEFNGELGHIPGAILLPVQQIEEWIKNYQNDKDKDFIMVCRSGNRSGIATKYFLEHSFTHVYNMSGGMLAWHRADYPVDKKPQK